MMTAESTTVPAGKDVFYQLMENVSIQDVQAAELLKQDANTLFSKKNYSQAIQKYTDAITLNPNSQMLYSNRAFAYIKIELFGAAIRDADLAIKLDSNYTKGYYRRAVANMGLGNLKEALKDFKTVIKVAPSDMDAKKKYTECEKELRRIEFEKAITFEEVTKKAIDLIGNISDIEVPKSYDGPVLEDEVTLQFLETLIKAFKDEKRLHKKYAYQIMDKAKRILEADEAIVDVKIPQGARLTVCGDVHGQFYDLMRIFEENGLPSLTNMYLWNGDFVDRGSWSVEVMLTLLTLKVLYPKSVFLSRGNHETDNMNKVF
jgi:serine/threonine-protein phosphatase 5